MEHRTLGKTGLSVSVLGFGGAEIGYSATTTQADVDALLNGAIDAGLNLIDTAAAYKTSEQLIGNAIGHRRKEFVLISKCGALDGFTRSDWSKDGVIETIQQSLRLLKTDYLDVAQLHSCDTAELKRGDAIEGLQRAVERGYTRFVGYSGDGADAKFAIEMNVFDTLQTSVSVADQQAIDLTVPLASARNMGVIAKRPVANAVWRNESKPNDSYHHAYWDRIQKLQYDFLNAHLTESIGTALRFTLGVPGVHTAIVGTTKPGRWSENAEQVRQGALDSKEFDAIRNRWRELSEDSWVGQV
jgi:aryl-alcohol dehydrogenase-like predicted oxidoreductase